jgi:hypothetical protein
MRTWTTMLATIVSLVALGAQGAAQRTFVSGKGNDVNPCTFTAPCRSFIAAINQTLSGGEVIVLSTGGFGSATITQSVSIIAPPGVYAGVSFGGMSINAPGIVVVLQGLTLSDSSPVSFLDGAELRISNCRFDFSTIAASAPSSRLFISDSVVNAISLTSSVTAIIDRVRVQDSAGIGISVSNGAQLSVRDSVIVNSGSLGVSVSAASGQTTRVTVDDSVIADNAGQGVGVTAQDAGSLATLDIIRTSSTRNTSGSGVATSGTAPGQVVVTVTKSMLSDNAVYGISSTFSSTVLANGNTISRNAGGGLNATAGGILHTRGNNVGEQAIPTSGTTPIAGF